MLILPENEKALGHTIKSLIYQADSLRRTRLPEWTINYAFLQGVRDFTTVDYLTGEVRYKYVNQYGKLRFKNEEILRYLQVEMGRFLGIDIRPSVEMMGWGLDRLRAAGIGQAILDYEISDRVLSRTRVPLIENFLVYGCTGVTGWVHQAGALSGRQMLETIPPWELFPIPATARNSENMKGLMRSRLIPLVYLKRLPEVGEKIKRSTQDELGVREMPWGEWESVSGDGVGDSPIGNVLGLFAHAVHTSMDEAFSGDATSAAKFREGRQVARVTECWLTTPDGLVTRYVMLVGEKVVLDRDFEADGATTYMPVGLARYYPAGFYGRSFVGPLMPFTSEMEKSLESIFQALRDLDALGIIGIPTGLGVSEQTFRISGHPRKFFFSPDPLDRSGVSPVHISPRPFGTFPAQGVQVGTAALDRIAGQSSLFSGAASGRADSAAAFGFLLETSNVGIEAPGNSLANAMVTVYTAILDAAEHRLTKQDLNRVINLENVPVGVSINEDGAFNLEANPIPKPGDVKINVRSRTPPSPQQEILELKEQLQMQVIDHRQFRLEIYRRGLKIPVSNEGEYQSWRKIRMNIRLLFNDGRTPRPERIAIHPKVDDIPLHMEELTAFMKSPEFAMAEVPVQEAFDDFLAQYDALLPGLVNQAPLPDELPPGRAGMQMAMGMGAPGGNGGAVPQGLPQ